MRVPDNTVFRWVRQDRIDGGERAGASTPETDRLRAPTLRIAEAHPHRLIAPSADRPIGRSPHRPIAPSALCPWPWVMLHANG